MSTQDRPQERGRDRDQERATGGLPTSAPVSAQPTVPLQPVVPAPSFSHPSTTPRVWALPTLGGGVWTVCAADNSEQFAQELESHPPVILSSQFQPDAQMLTETANSMERTFRVCGQDSIFSFLKRTVICGALLVSGFVARRLPGELKLLDAVLVGGSIVYFVYSTMRYGGAAMRWHNRRIDARRFIQRGKIQHSPLCDRLAKALELRARLSEAERGSLPDEELLDSNAYRKLIRDNVISAGEFFQLGRMIDAQLGFHLSANKERKMSELAHNAGLDVPSAIFYRDLSDAAAEIRLETSVSDVFKS